jgi:hypothetical protein
VRRIAWIAAACFVVAGCASFPAEYRSLVGTWEGDGLDMTIRSDGDVLYERTSGNEKITFEGPLKSVSDQEIVFGFFFLRHKLAIQQPPHVIDGRYEMVLENVRLVGPYSDGPLQDRLPVFRPYTGPDGGYVAVYTHDRDHAVYSVSEDIYVAGLVRVPGRYVDRIFYPTGYGPGDDITHDAAILELCDRYFPELRGKEWIGGDTGGYSH